VTNFGAQSHKVVRVAKEFEPETRAGGRVSGSVLPRAVLAYRLAEAGPQGFGAQVGD